MEVRNGFRALANRFIGVSESVSSKNHNSVEYLDDKLYINEKLCEFAR